ncbi:MAG: NADPH-dependent FMN reductase [Cohaesibacteraceae bacterium]
MSSVRLLALSGSTRDGSVNTKLASTITSMASNVGFDAVQISLADHPAPLFDADWEKQNGPPEPIKALQALMVEQDAIFVASPEYNGGITPLLKNTIDWLSRVRVEGQPGSLVFKKPVWSLGAVSPGVQGGVNSLYQLRPTITRLGAIVMPEQLTVGGGASAFNEDGSFANDRTINLATAQLERLFDVAGKLKS